MDTTIVGILCNLIITVIGLISSIMTVISFLSSAPTSPPMARLKKVGIISALVVITFFGVYSAWLWALPGYSIWEHQHFYDQTIQQLPSTRYSLQTANAWETALHPGIEGNGGACHFHDQMYDITMTTKNYFYPCYSKAAPLRNFICLVEMRIEKGDAGGIVFRDDSKRPDLYYFHIDADGAYALNYWPNATTSEPPLLLAGTSNVFFRDQIQEGRKSLVAIVARGSDLSIFIDGTYVGSTQDNRIAGGRIALTAYKILNDTEVIYDQVRVWTL